MLETRRLELQSQMDAALAANDAAKVEALRRTIDRETLECTAHTAERLKRVEKDVSEIKETVYEIRDKLSAEIREVAGALAALKHRAEGARWLWNVLKVLAGAGGGAAVLKALGG